MVASATRQLVYNAGRLTSYGFIGALAGVLGQVVCTGQGIVLAPFDGGVDLAQRALAIAAGALMIVMALSFFGVRIAGAGVAGMPGFAGRAFADALRGLARASGPAAPLALGVFNGFLPCPLVYAVAAQAASTAGAAPGFFVMTAFGLGTFPAMLAMGGLGRVLAPQWRRRGVRVAGSFILAVGLLTIGRGVVPGVHLGHPL
jgi:sulfite exporter TauE/SafE